MKGGRRSREELLCSDHDPHSPRPCTTQGERGREIRKKEVKLSLGKKSDRGEVLIFVFLSHHSYLC